MAIRNHTAQNLHDRIVQFAASQLDLTTYDVFTNPGIQQNVWIGENVPDIVVTDKLTFNVKYIIEVETAATVNISEASNQWKKFSDEIRASFYLLVPATHKSIASILCKQVGIYVGIGTYTLDVYENIISISYD